MQTPGFGIVCIVLYNTVQYSQYSPVPWPVPKWLIWGIKIKVSCNQNLLLNWAWWNFVFDVLCWTCLKVRSRLDSRNHTVDPIPDIRKETAETHKISTQYGDQSTKLTKKKPSFYFPSVSEPEILSVSSPAAVADNKTLNKYFKVLPCKLNLMCLSCIRTTPGLMIGCFHYSSLSVLQ